MLQSAREHPRFCCFACSSSPRSEEFCRQQQTQRTSHLDGMQFPEPSCHDRSATIAQQ